MTPRNAPIGTKWAIEDRLKAAALDYVHALDCDMFSHAVVASGAALVDAAKKYEAFATEYPDADPPIAPI